MIGLDTNVLVRYILEDDPVWSLMVTDYVISELNSAAGALTTVTIDKKASRSEPFGRLKLKQ